MVFDLSSDDLEKFNRLIRITKTISNLYEELYELEKYSLKESLKYKRILDNLRLSIEVENNMYEELDLTASRCFSFLQYLYECKLPEDFPNNITSIGNLDYENKIFRRIENKIVRRQKQLYGDTLISDEDFENRKIITRIYNFKDSYEEYKMETKILESIFIDFYNLYLYFLNEGLNDKNLSCFQDDLLLAKYYLSFIDKDIEENLLKSDLKIVLPAFYYSEYLKSISSIPTSFYENIKEKFLEVFLTSILLNLLQFKDEVVKNSHLKLRQLIISYFLRCILVIDSQIGEFIISIFLEEIDDKELKEASISINLIKEALRKCEEDKKNIELQMFSYDEKRNS